MHQTTVLDLYMLHTSSDSIQVVTCTRNMNTHIVTLSH